VGSEMCRRDGYLILMIYLTSRIHSARYAEISG